MISLLNSVKPDEAQGMVKDVYNGFSQKLGKVPNVIQFHTASPKVYGHLMGVINEFTEHPTLDSVFQAFLRTLISNRVGGKYCENFQSYLLLAYGISQEKIDAGIKDPSAIEMEDKQKELLLFVLNVITEEKEITPEDVDKLHKLGWNDQEIYEACFIGGLQRGMIFLVKGFKVELDY